MFRPTRILLAAGIKYVPYSHIPYPQSHPSFIPSCSSTLQSQYRSSLVYSCSPRPIKFSTGITGLPPHPDPLPILRATYTSTLHLLSNLPPTSVYRQATEAITKHRLQLVEKAGEDVKAVEGELGMVEGILEEAKAEQALVGKMLEWKSWVSLLKGRGGERELAEEGNLVLGQADGSLRWEGLEVESPQGQWTYFDPGSEGESTPSA